MVSLGNCSCIISNCMLLVDNCCDVEFVCVVM